MQEHSESVPTKHAHPYLKNDRLMEDKWEKNLT